MSEGYIKFHCIWEEEEVQFPDAVYHQLEAARNRLHALKLIGNYANGIGYGNISVRQKGEKSFIISGSATGGLSVLIPSDYALVTDYKIEENTLFCRGLIQASSESLTHAAVYASVPSAGAVVHIHCQWLWEKLLDRVATTHASIEYGTPEMAVAVGELAFDIKGHDEKIIIMAGHQEGILLFGDNISHVTQQIIELYDRYQPA